MKDKPVLVYIITKSSWGGAQKYVYDLAVAFTAHYDVHVICGENEFGTDNTFTSLLQQSGITVHQLSHMRKEVSLLQEYRSYRQIKNILRRIKPDVVHLNSSKMAIVGSWAAWWSGINQIVYTAHGFPFVDTSRSVWKNKIIEWATRLGLIAVDAVITISQREYNIVDGWIESRHKKHLIYNGLKPVDFLDPQDAQGRLSENLPDPIREKINRGAVVLGSVAELRPNKGVSVLIEALSQLSSGQDWVYLHMGTGSEHQTIEEQIQQSGLSDCVCLCGFIKEASRYLKAFDMFVLPSLQEGTPYGIVEAAQAELPVVATQVGAVGEMVTDGISGKVVLPHEATELARAIDWMLDHPQERQVYARKLHTQSAQRFDFQTMINQTQAVYNG